MKNKSALDDHKLKYELTENDPKKPKKKVHVIYDESATLDDKTVKQVKKLMKPKRPSIIRAYFRYLVEVVLS